MKFKDILLISTWAIMYTGCGICTEVIRQHKLESSNLNKHQIEKHANQKQLQSHNSSKVIEKSIHEGGTQDEEGPDLFTMLRNKSLSHDSESKGSFPGQSITHSAGNSLATALDSSLAKSYAEKEQRRIEKEAGKLSISPLGEEEKTSIKVKKQEQSFQDGSSIITKNPHL